MTRALTLIATLATGAVFGLATPAQAYTPSPLCQGYPEQTRSTTTSWINGVVMKSYRTYRVCWNAQQQRLVEEVYAIKSTLYLGTSNPNCGGPFGPTGWSTNWRVWDGDGHGYNPGGRDLGCPSDGSASYTFTSSPYLTRVHDGSWSNVLVAKFNGPDQSVTHSGGFPLP